MIVSKRSYDRVAAGGQHVTRWQAKKVRVEILNPIEIRTANDGELQVREGVFDAFQCIAHDAEGMPRPVGCPAPIGTVKELRFRDETGKRRGRIDAIVVAARPYVGNDGRPMWEITWERAGTKKHPIPDRAGGVYLAAKHGYTSSPARALDDEAPVIPDEDVLAAIADDSAFTREQRRRRLLEMKRRTEAISARIEEALQDLDHEQAA